VTPLLRDVMRAVAEHHVENFLIVVQMIQDSMSSLSHVVVRSVSQHVEVACLCIRT
jgi:hypothetical protein